MSHVSCKDIRPLSSGEVTHDVCHCVRESDRKRTEQVTQLWQSSLHNANIDTQRYVVGEDRVIFMLKDGAKAWEIKDFLVQQDRCSVVTIEGQDYPGKAAEKKNPDKNRASKKDTESKKKSKESKNDANKIKKEKKVEL
ncbi:hypothetical protein ScPMuIL_002957 [Solemya velum]